MDEQSIDLKDWKQKVHAIDMVLRTVQNEAANEEQKRRSARFAPRKPKLPFTRTSPSPL
jgi:hypothetical protein